MQHERAIVDAIAAEMETRFVGESSGHDWWHIKRVWENTNSIGIAEGARMDIAELGALLHDIADWKFHGGDDTAGPREAAALLERHGAEAGIIEHVRDIVATISYKGAGVATPMNTLEGKVVQDADRLDALGAIGIARAFAYGGHAGSAMHDPGAKPLLHATPEEYKRARGTTVNHFYEKLLLLPERMQTETGRKLALERRAYMEDFLRRFLEEWEG